MKPIAILAAPLFAVCASLPVVAQRSPLPPPGPLEHITGNLYKIFGGGGNTLVFLQTNGVVLVDTKLPGTGQAILDQVRTVTDKPITTIINTHNHPDHVGSTDFFREKFPKVQVISQENTKKWVEKNPQYKPEVVPSITFKDRMTIGKGDDRIELYYFGVAHTDGDAFVVIPAARAMFLGDVMAWNMAPLIDPPTGGSVIALPDALEKAAQTVKGVDTVIEGHGYVNTWDGYLRFTRFNRALLTAARAAYERGDPPGAAVAELRRVPEFAPLLGTDLLPGLEYGNTPLSRAHMNVNVAYQQLAGETVTTNFGARLPATNKHKASDPKDTAAPLVRPVPAAPN
jgi:glyoxylase-like metal-dependent hydrolase (beta-lactamase superfamily II)